MARPLRAPSSRLVRAAVAAAAVLALWLVAPEAVEATVSTPGALLRVAAVCAVLVGWSFAVRRLLRNRALATVVAVAPAVAVAWWALTPYLTDDEIDEAFPTVEAAAPPDDGRTGTTAAPPTAKAAEGAGAGTAPAEPTALLTGGFRGLTGHRGEGAATVFELGDGTRVLRLEDLDVSNGPDLQVHLVPGAAATNPAGGVKLADLKANQGNQNYDVPPDLDLGGEWTVLIWCEAFTVEVAHAPLRLADGGT